MRRILLFMLLFFCSFLVSVNQSAATAMDASWVIEAPGDDIRVFPNPAIDYFQVVNGQNVRKIVIFNIFGKEVKSFVHSANAQYDVTDMNAGMYLVRMLDDKNKVVKSVKLHKNAG
jgi:hypothetical protein